MIRRLVLFVEGVGDVYAMPILIRKLLHSVGQWQSSMFLDDDPFRIGGVERLVENTGNWLRHLKAALKRSNVGGVLVVLDGDKKKWEQRSFCAADVARTLVHRAKAVGAGATFSLGIVFACCEYETWLLAGIDSLAGKPLTNGRPGILANTVRIAGDLESHPRDAKGELSKRMHSGYKESLDQAELTTLLDVETVRQHGLRSFSRLEHAVKQLADACQTGVHVATPPSP